jgi:hypothetical protein
MLVRILFAALLAIHGLIHFMGVAKAFGLAELEALSRPISPGMGVVWLLAGLAFLASAPLVLRGPGAWWWLAGGGVVLSQIAIVASWSDARFGTLANVLVLVGVVYAAAATGPWSFRATYREAVREGLAGVEGAASPVVTEADLAALPEPVRGHLRASGAVGRPRPTWFRIVWRGRIRGGPEEPWMEFTAEQHNVLGPPSRFFLMDATRGGLPVDVLHAYRGGTATMQVRLLSLVPMVDARGPEMDQAETVTVLNDLALFAPGALLDPRISWEAVDSITARALFTVGSERVSATLHFDPRSGELVDFVSDDRYAADSDGGTFRIVRWSTPVEGYRDFDGVRAPSRGVGLWHPEGSEPWAYLEGEVVELEVGPAFTTGGR